MKRCNEPLAGKRKGQTSKTKNRILMNLNPIYSTCLVTALLIIAASGVPAKPGPEAAAQSSLVEDQRWRRAQHLTFVQNRGQLVDSEGNPRGDILYSARQGGVQIFFRESGVSYVLAVESEAATAPIDESSGRPITAAAEPTEFNNEPPSDLILCRIDVNFGSAAASLTGEDKVDEYFNYYLGHCPQGITHVPGFRRLVYRNVYDKIDMVYYGSGGAVKYDFIVHPGGDPRDIALHYVGAQALRIGPEGGLIAETPLGQMRESAPRSFLSPALNPGRQPSSFREVASRYALAGDTLRFALADWDRSQTLVIDPELHWATYLGDVFNERATDVATQGNPAAGFQHLGYCHPDLNIYVCGWTHSFDFPLCRQIESSYRMPYSAAADAFVSSYTQDGDLRWTTFYGGGGNDRAEAIEASWTGKLAVCGTTSSADFPLSAALQNSFGGGSSDAFVAAFNTYGLRQWSTYYGGSGRDRALGLDIDEVVDNGAVFVTGSTEGGLVDGSGAAISGAHQSAFGGGVSDAFILAIDEDGAYKQAGYYGGSQEDVGADIAISKSVNINPETYHLVITGWTNSTLLAVGSHAADFQNEPIGGHAGFEALLAKFSYGLNSIDWAFSYGGNGDDRGLAIDARGSQIAVAGRTSSDNLYIWQNWSASSGGVLADGNPAQPTYGAGQDAFLLNIQDFLPANPGGYDFHIQWSSYFGGGNVDHAEDLTIDSDGALWTTGFTQSDDLNLSPDWFGYSGGYYGGGHRGNDDAFVAGFQSSGELLWSQYFGSPNHDVARGIAIDRLRGLVIAGWTNGGQSDPLKLPGTEDNPDNDAEDCELKRYSNGCEDVFVARFQFVAPQIFDAAQLDLAEVGVSQNVDVATDNLGNISVVGTVALPTLPVKAGVQMTLGGGNDAYIGHFTPGGKPQWVTYYGGSNNETGRGVCADPNRNVVVTGETASVDFPLTSGTHAANVQDVFVLRLEESGLLDWTSIHGGPGRLHVRGLDADLNANVGIAGWNNDTHEMFVLRLNSSGLSDWSFLRGDSDLLLHAHALTFDGNNNLIVSGLAAAGDTGPFSISGVSGTLKAQLSDADGVDALVVKLNSAGAPLWYSFFGSSGMDIANGIAVNGANDIVVSGLSSSSDLNNPMNLPDISAEALDGAYGGGGRDGLLVKFTSAGLLSWWSYFGGDDNDAFSSDPAINWINGSFTVGGSTSSLNLSAETGIVPSPIDYSGLGYDDIETGLLVKFNSAGAPQWLTNLGLHNSSFISSLAIDPYTNIVLGGYNLYRSLDGSSPFSRCFGFRYMAKFRQDGTLWTTLNN